MNGRNARKRMINKIKTTIWKKQRKVAIRMASVLVMKKVCCLNFIDRFKFLFSERSRNEFSQSL